MEPPRSSDKPFLLDRAFLDEVEKELEHSLEVARKLEEDPTELPVLTAVGRNASLDQLQEKLVIWQGRLAALTERTAAMEADLLSQERALNNWFQALRHLGEQAPARQF